MDFFNEDHEKVLTFEFNEKFDEPFIIHDVLKEKEKTPEIKVTTDANILSRINFILYAKPIEKKYAWAKRQRYIIYLFPMDAPTEKDYKIIRNLPPNHFLELDTANNKIRVVGSFVYGGKSQWLPY